MSARTARRASPPDQRRPLVVTRDPLLLDELLDIAEEAAVPVDVSADPVHTVAGVPLILVGADVAGAWSRGFAPAQVILVSRTGDPPWHLAEQAQAGHVAVLPAARPWLLQRLGRCAGVGVGAAPVVAILGGRGGAGASVLAAALAVTAAHRGLDTLLIDADPLGGGLDLLLGWEGLDGLRWSELSHTSGPIHPPALVEALPRRDRLVVLSFDRQDLPEVPREAMAAALSAGRRGRGLVVVDLPRRLDHGSLIALAEADRAFLVVPAELRACAAAARVAEIAGRHCPRLAIIVRGPAPGGLTSAEVARAVRLPMAGYLRTDVGLARALERGEAPGRAGRGPLAGLCRRVLDDLGARRAGGRGGAAA